LIEGVVFPALANWKKGVPSEEPKSKYNWNFPYREFSQKPGSPGQNKKNVDGHGVFPANNLQEELTKGKKNKGKEHDDRTTLGGLPLW